MSPSRLRYGKLKLNSILQINIELQQRRKKMISSMMKRKLLKLFQNILVMQGIKYRKLRRCSINRRIWNYPNKHSQKAYINNTYPPLPKRIIYQVKKKIRHHLKRKIFYRKKKIHKLSHLSWIIKKTKIHPKMSTNLWKKD